MKLLKKTFFTDCGNFKMVISKFVNHYLKPHAEALPSYIKKRRRGLQKNWKPTAADPNKRRSRIYSKNHGNFIRLRKAITRSILRINDPNGYVINSSKYSFTKGQYNLLNKNLNFCPTPGYYNNEELKRDTGKIKIG